MDSSSDDEETRFDNSSVGMTSERPSQVDSPIDIEEHFDTSRDDRRSGSESEIESDSDASSSVIDLDVWQPHWERVRQGLEVPLDDYPLTRDSRKSLLQGIRKSLAIALSAVVGEFLDEADGGADLSLIRNKNARLIMSDIIPTDRPPEHMPYCIWYPDFATERAYNLLYTEYPDMRYQIARACAAAGYVDLYQRLDVLPEVAVAEEAREAGSKSREIFESIMQAPVRYAIMDDYTCSIRSGPPRAAFLNGDTAVRSILSKPPPQELFYFDITEDAALQTFNHNREDVVPYALSDSEVELLYSPLPHDLPTSNKDLLILMAAFHGDTDRYARLRRPMMLPHEQACVLRGMLHNPGFSRWMETQISPGHRYYEQEYRQYACCRRIMSNDLSWLTSEASEIGSIDPPQIIWNPQIPHEATLAALVIRVPSMTQVVARACIKGDYHRLFDRINWKPDHNLYCDARGSHRSHYLEKIKERASETEWTQFERWGSYQNSVEEMRTTDELEGRISADSMRPLVFTDAWVMLNHGALHECTADRVHHYMYAPESLRREARGPEYDGSLFLYGEEMEALMARERR